MSVSTVLILGVASSIKCSSCGIAHILGMLLMISYDIQRFSAKAFISIPCASNTQFWALVGENTKPYPIISDPNS